MMSYSPDFSAEIRIVEAILFASTEPISETEIKQRIKRDFDIKTVLQKLQTIYATRGINLVPVAGKWAFRTAPDLAYLLQRDFVVQKKLSQAALETLAIIAYHQPVTRAEIEEIRGVTISKGTIDVLMEIDWIKMRGKRQSPGRPITYGTTEQFLNHFVLNSIEDLPDLDELKGAGLLDSAFSINFSVPKPTDEPTQNPIDLPFTLSTH